MSTTGNSLQLYDLSKPIFEESVIIHQSMFTQKYILDLTAFYFEIFTWQKYLLPR